MRELRALQLESLAAIRRQAREWRRHDLRGALSANRLRRHQRLPQPRARIHVNGSLHAPEW